MLPGRHALHVSLLSAPDLVLNMPTAQRIQSASVLLPVIALKRPAGHGLKARATEPMPALEQ